MTNDFEAPSNNHYDALEIARLQRAACRVRQLPARALAELLAEIGRTHGQLEDVIQRTERYAKIEPELLAAAGGDRLIRTMWAV